MSSLLAKALQCGHSSRVTPSCSVTGLKRQLADARARRAAAAAPGEADAAGDAGDTGAQPAAEPVEWGRIFSEEDFERIRCGSDSDGRLLSAD